MPPRFLILIALAPLIPLSRAQATPQQPPGSIRGVVFDKDFHSPLPAAKVTILDTRQKVFTTDQGTFVFPRVPSGRYTLTFSKDGYLQQLQADVAVSPGKVTEVKASLPGDFTEMQEFVVQDLLQLAPGTEASLLKLRFQSPSLIDSISADLMSRAGASDAASALRFVSGASLKDGKSAVIRGLPDRYISSQMNGVRLPSADEDKRAVELDQFPSAIIESVRVTKTFTPDHQGDASGGAVDVILKGFPKDPLFFQFKSEVSYNSQVTSHNDFLSYRGGGLAFFGGDDGSRDIQYQNLGGNWDGAAGTSTRSAPTDYKWATAAGGMHDFGNGIKLGGFASFFYKRDSSFDDHGRNDSYWVTSPGDPLTPQLSQFQGSDDFKTALFDVTKGQQSVQWGGLATVGLETKNQSLSLTYLFTKTTDDTATLAIDTRGKQYFFPGYDPNDPTTPGHAERNAAPYLRLETLAYTERTTDTLQLHGKHTLPIGTLSLGPSLKFLEPQIDWTAAWSSARLNQPDKRQFGALWLPERVISPTLSIPASWRPFKPAANFTLGNFQRIWKDIEENSSQYSVNLKLPFEQWSGDEGYFKFGLFSDSVDRTFRQYSFSNFNDNSSYAGSFEQPWSSVFPSENHPITESNNDVNYDGQLDISAGYAMLDIPLFSSLHLVGGARIESTDIAIVNDPEAFATWFPPGSVAPTMLNPGDADVDFHQRDILPSIAFVWDPFEHFTLRGSYSETVARQTFKELSPIIQQEFLGGPTFIGNPTLGMSSIRNYDLRIDYRPLEGGLLSASFFHKDIKDPIEFVQRIAPFTFTTPVNYPDGNITGIELEMRQALGQIWSPLKGLSIGANATIIDSEVTLPADEVATFAELGTPISKRDMTGTPEHLYNLFLTYDLPSTGTQASIFYTVTGDTLIVGAGEALGNFVPNIYAKQFGTLNISLSQKLGKFLKLQIQAKNLTNPKIKTVYRSDFTSGDTTNTSFSKGIDLSISLSGEFRF